MKRATKKKREKSQRQKSQRQKSQRRGRSSDMATLEVQAANDDFGRGTQSAQGNEVINHFEGALRRAGESFRRAGEAFAAQLVNAGEAFADPVVMKVLDRWGRSGEHPRFVVVSPQVARTLEVVQPRGGEQYGRYMGFPVVEDPFVPPDVVLFIDRRRSEARIAEYSQARVQLEFGYGGLDFQTRVSGPSTTHTFPFSMFAPGSTIEHVDGLDQHRPASEPEPEPEPQPIRAIELE